MMRAPLVGLLLLAACGKGGGDEGETAAPAVVTAKTAIAAQGVFQETVNATGEVAARPGSVAELGAPGPTRVARVMVALGQRVRAGQPLVTFDQTTFAAEARTAEAALANAEHAHERARRLAEAGIVAAEGSRAGRGGSRGGAGHGAGGAAHSGARDAALAHRRRRDAHGCGAERLGGCRHAADRSG